MASQDEEDKKLRRLLTWLGVLVGLVVAGVLTLALWEAHKNGDLGFGQPEAQVPSRAQVENGQVNMVPQTGDYALVENGIVKFYFATGSSNLAPNAEEVLAVVVDGVKHGRRAVISGYHDHTGNAEVNAEVSKNRAIAVQNALLALGVPQESIELRKPEVAQGSGSDAEARRVEVLLVD
ncbi:OmpA family protein [Neisseria shayeganii]|uniref:Cytochrome c oxidase, subunit II n=1 Tax=Neisseria shayeganii 871 TaxID=1032488 RepID=G4CKJ6_9NEIS|nr:OmpA family protein [Neisseria shayeganii]EGY51672.1 cytochrome c oxidase, subunit II [Neisseria shayeganii 871]